jgi:hypothetical protein
MNQIECPGCGHKLKYAPEHVGKKAKCQKCGKAFVLPPILQPEEEAAPLVPGHPEIKEVVPILCEHCSESFGVQNAMGLSIRCNRCQKITCVSLLDTSKLPGPHGPGERGCVPSFRGDPAHYRAVFAAGARAKARRQKLLDEGVLPGLLLARWSEVRCGVEGEFAGGLKLAGANLQGSLFVLEPKVFESADLRGANLEGAIWWNSSLKDVRFDGANLRQCAILGSFGINNLAGASFRGADLSGAEVDLVTLGEVDFTGANLEKAKLVGGKEVKLNFRDARMKGCKVSEFLLPLLSEHQRAEVELMVLPGSLTPDEQKMEAARDRRFRSVPIVGTKSQTHSYGPEAGSATATETTYAISDAREHILEDHRNRHLLNWVWPVAGLAGAFLGFAASAVGYLGFSWPLAWVSLMPLIAGLVGAVGGLAESINSRRLYRQQAWKDRGWKPGEKRPNLHIVFEHEWRGFTSRLR